MASVRQCDKCKTTTDVTAWVSVYRKRKFKNLHDGEFLETAESAYGLCENCARELEVLIVGDNAEKVPGKEK